MKLIKTYHTNDEEIIIIFLNIKICSEFSLALSQLLNTFSMIKRKKFKKTHKRDLLLWMNLHSSCIQKSVSYLWFAVKIIEFPIFFFSNSECLVLKIDLNYVQ